MNSENTLKQYPSGKEAIRYFESVRWGDKPKCAYCESENLWERRTDQRFKCRDCNNTFSVTTKTHLHNTRQFVAKNGY